MKVRVWIEASDKRHPVTLLDVDVARFKVLDRFTRIGFKLLLVVVSDEFDKENLIPFRFLIASAVPLFELDVELRNDWYKMLCLHPLMKFRQFLYILL